MLACEYVINDRAAMNMHSLNRPRSCPSDRRSQWAASDEDCQQKLTFFLWLKMKAEATENDKYAQHVLNYCLILEEVTLVEIHTNGASK